MTKPLVKTKKEYYAICSIDNDTQAIDTIVAMVTSRKAAERFIKEAHEEILKETLADPHNDREVSLEEIQEEWMYEIIPAPLWK